jgi:type II secretion system protein J
MIGRRTAQGFTLIELMVAVFITAIVLSMGYGAVNQALQNREALDVRAERLHDVQNTVRILTQDFTQLTPRPVRQPIGDGWLPALASGTDMSGGLGSTTSTLSSTGSGLGSTSSGSSSSGLGSSPSGFGSTSSGLGSSGSGGLGSDSGLGSSGGLGLGSSSGSGAQGSAFGSSSSGLSSSSPASSNSSGSSTSTATSTSTSTSTSSLDNKGPITLVAFTRTGWANPAGIQRPALERVTYILENGTLRREHSPELDVTTQTPTVRRELLDKVKSVTLRYMDVSFNWRQQWPPPLLAGDPTANLRLRPIAVEVTLELEDWGKIVRVIEIPG